MTSSAVAASAAGTSRPSAFAVLRFRESFDNLPFFRFATHNVPCTANPLGIKGAGEAGAVGAPPAVINAIIDALHRKAGIRHIDMPATPRRIWEALQRPAA